MTYLSEDPTLLAGGLLVLAGAFLVALRVTQQGKYLVRAGVALGLALAVVMIEWLWVTDNERIEQVVYDLRRAVLDSDVEGVLKQMAPDVDYQTGEMSLPGEATRALIRANLSNSRFDFIRISHLETSAGEWTRRGKADFHVFAKGTLNMAGGMATGGTAETVWSLGFRETEPGVWKVNRITPILIPTGALAMPGGPPTGAARIGLNDGTGTPRPNARFLPFGRRLGP